MHNGRSQIQSVVTYNYDNLLELALNPVRTQPIWQGEEELIEHALPIYHVHGFVPLSGRGSNPEHIVFTEDQYNLAAHNAYSWSNLVQIKCLCNSVGLMIGLSLTDRNMRRLLDALKRAPVRRQNYILMQVPRWQKPDTHELHRIDGKAREYLSRFPSGGRKKDERRYTEIEEIIGAVEESDRDEQESVFTELGLRTLWYEDHSEVPEILRNIMRNE